MFSSESAKSCPRNSSPRHWWTAARRWRTSPYTQWGCWCNRCTWWPSRTSSDDAGVQADAVVGATVNITAEHFDGGAVAEPVGSDSWMA